MEPLVLVVEDDAETLGWLQLIIRDELGYQVALATDVAQGLARAQRHTPVVAVVDIRLPRLDGYELARRVRADRRLAGCWLIALTAYSTGPECRRAGFDQFFGKPVDLDELLDAIRDGVEKAKARTEAEATAAEATERAS